MKKKLMKKKSGKSKSIKSKSLKHKWVYLFNEVNQAEKKTKSWEGVRALLGGKGANLAEMTRIRVSVPPGFTITTEACNATLAGGGKFPGGMWDQVMDALQQVEKQAGKKFGDPANPLLVSCRSGSKFSMPGMMDTVLNIGLNEETVEGMIKLTGDPRFVYDAYRRLIQMFGTVVMGLDAKPFHQALEEAKARTGVTEDSKIPASVLKGLVATFKKIVRDQAGRDFPNDPLEQLKLATEAVFRSWNGKRAVDYRNAAKIAHDLGTAVNIVTMVFGNMGDDSATGVAMTRSGNTGDPEIEGDYLTNAQGEDVVAGIRNTKQIAQLKEEMPEVYRQFAGIAKKLEKHYRNMQDVEFTVEHGKLWMLQTRDGKRTAQAEVRIAVDMVKERLISKREAVGRVKPEQIDFYLHPQFDGRARKAADKIASGLNVSPGAAVGQIAYTADLAEKWVKQEKKQVIMVRPETGPADVHGMLAANGILTSKGGRTSHAALVARQFGKPAVVGVAALDVDVEAKRMTVGGKVYREGDWVSIDGTTGEVFAGQVPTVVPDLNDPYLSKLLSWADSFRRLQVWANADYPRDAQRARNFGAQGIGLCRTEHMFFETERLPIVQKMILAETFADKAEAAKQRREALDQLLPFQRSDFEGLFRAMDGLPVIIRLIDPPMHEFLPAHDALLVEVTELKITGKDPKRLAEAEQMLAAVEAMREANPMLGLRGVRLGIHIPELTQMQVRAIIEAAVTCAKDGVDVHPEIMIPLTSHVNELKVQQTALEEVAKQVMKEQGTRVRYKFGTMIELPRAALTAGEIAEYARFFSFGTNDLTQTTYGISRDDAEKGFLMEYLNRKILSENPFASIDEAGVGKLMAMAVKDGRATRPNLEVGICGEHGGDPKSIWFCHRIGLNYVSCSPFRIPIARLAAAQAALDAKNEDR
ncbi:MAG: pyruvate, phosphate dikinase [Desulfobacterales bacterium]|nr:pyruvate, phosphate dikinase [Desulfobacterales bacterium]